MFGPWWARKTAAASKNQRAKLTQLGLKQRRPPTTVPSSSKPPLVRAARVVPPHPPPTGVASRRCTRSWIRVPDSISATRSSNAF